jgi:hypothetical protein
MDFVAVATPHCVTGWLWQRGRYIHPNPMSHYPHRNTHNTANIAITD